ncbi:MAG: pseudouridine synthase [Gammaproteobacteria bacterium]|nr:pseudouridine synthase [Gammaproteobacteria bacterium]
MIVLFNKPFNVLSQFTDTAERSTLSDYITIQTIYAAGRLDKDSEGLLVLTDDGNLQHLISHPKAKLIKIYWAQVEGQVQATAINQLRSGVRLKEGMTAPAGARIIEKPAVWSRTPPIRYRAAIPTTWIEIQLSEGRNRQVRRMTAAVGHPTLRLIRYAIGPWTLTCISQHRSRQQSPDTPAINATLPPTGTCTTHAAAPRTLAAINPGQYTQISPQYIPADPHLRKEWNKLFEKRRY